MWSGRCPCLHAERGRHLPESLAIGVRHLDVLKPIGGVVDRKPHLTTRETVMVGLQMYNFFPTTVVENARVMVTPDADASAIPFVVEEAEPADVAVHALVPVLGGEEHPVSRFAA